MTIHLLIASEASSKNQCVRENERAKPTVTSRIKIWQHPIMLSNAFSQFESAMPNVANILLVIHGALGIKNPL